MTYKPSDPRPFGCAVLVALSIATLILTPVGPIFVYPWLVPVIAPVLPKPEDVPSRAKAEYQWKGFGLTWYWEDRVTGCAQLWAADFYGGPVRGLSIYEGGKNCEEGERTLYRLSFLDHTTFGSGENGWGDEECPFALSNSSVNRLQLQVEELIGSSSGKIETKMLEETRHEIEQIERLGLRAQQYGCRVNRQ